jgi:hypothetical protein
MSAPMSAPQPLSMVDVALRCHTMFPAIRLRQYGEILIDKDGVERTATGKEATVKDWTTMTPWDVRKIEREWAGIHANANCGARMGQEINRMDSWLFCVDEDAGGAETVAQWEAQYGALPSTYEQVTWSGKKHRVYRSSRPIATSIKDKAIGKGIDIIGDGGQIVYSGSLIRGVRYKDNNAAIVDAPDWLLNLCTTKKTTAPKIQTPIDGLSDQPEDIRWAVSYLTKDAKPAIEGQAGDLTTLKTAAVLKDHGISRDKAKELMAVFYNVRCSPQWSAAELDEKVDNAYNHCRLQAPGEATARADFDVVEPEPVSDPAWLTEMNARHLLVNEGGRASVFTKAYDSVLARDVYDIGTLDDLKKLYGNRFVEIRDPRTHRRIVVDQASAWQVDPRRRQYLGGARYAPNERLPSDTLNLWQGFAITPKQGSWARMEYHLHDIWCDRNDAAFTYLKNWLARLVQYPGEQGRVAVVSCGPKGCGKGALGNALLKMFGSHGLHVTNPELFIGRFNGHLYGTSFLFVDEAYWAPNRAHEGALKALISEPALHIERKFQTPFMAKNSAHLLLGSNASWAIPATGDERRFFVLNVSNRHARDAKYFAPLWAEMQGAGLNAMLYDLLAHSLDGFDVDTVPQTEGLTEQKIASLESTDRWVYECLCAGHLGGTIGWNWSEDATTAIRKQSAYREYCDWSHQCRDYKPASLETWAKTIRKALGVCVRTSRPRGTDGDRPWQFTFAPLGECRAAFEQHLGAASLPWQIDDAESAHEVAHRLMNDAGKLIMVDPFSD